jgi:hypothetical protein
MQLLKALLLQGVADSCDACWVAPRDLMEATQTEQQVLKAVARMLLQSMRQVRTCSKGGTMRQHTPAESGLSSITSTGGGLLAQKMQQSMRAARSWLVLLHSSCVPFVHNCVRIATS